MPRMVVPGRAPDRMGLPAYCRVVHESFIDAGAGTVGHEAHEFGHYFGLWHTFDGGGLRDVPPDTKENKWWRQQSVEYCGNARSGIVNGVTYTPDRINNESYWGCLVSRAHTAFSPQQLGKMQFNLTQLNRYPLVACQPVNAYDANNVECENSESLALCRQTAEYLKAKTDTTMQCRLGGAFTRGMAHFQDLSAVWFVLQNTPAGIALVRKLAGLAPQARPSAATVSAVLSQLAAGVNLPLTMAIVRRLQDLQAQAITRSAALGKTAFASREGDIAATDQRILIELAQIHFPAGFTSNVPAFALH
jgi:hypothetical protein